jgi:hypothetical protein
MAPLPPLHYCVDSAAYMLAATRCACQFLVGAQDHEPMRLAGSSCKRGSSGRPRNCSNTSGDPYGPAKPHVGWRIRCGDFATASRSPLQTARCTAGCGRMARSHS